MTLRIHDTLSRKKIDFEPRDKKNVRMYVCGPTVYDYAHIGNARPVVVFDVLYRLLKRLYPKVTYVRNITDVDDKINAAAKEQGIAIGDITKRTTKIFHDDMKALGALDPDHEPRATEHIDGMIKLTQKLIESGHAYEKDGHVLFSVPDMETYGKLSRLNRDELIAGARVEVAPYKKDPADFVLWKPSTDELPGWDSPWGRSPRNPKGRGRPGWHLECSVMSEKFLGPEFDIHGGGQDLIFPHHENEIAQSTCMDDSGFAKYWMHNGYLMTEGEKMSKSLGNFYTVHDLLEEFPGEAIRLALLKTHYRQPLDFTKAGIAEAKRELDRMYRALDKIKNVRPFPPKNPLPIAVPTTIEESLKDDLNTPMAISVLRQFEKYIFEPEKFSHLPSGYPAHVEMGEVKYAFLKGAELLGLLGQDPEDWFKWQPAGVEGGLDDGAIDALIAERNGARADKDFQRSDKIRDQLAAEGIILEDGAEGTTWKRG